MQQNVWKSIMENVVFVMQFLGIVAAIFLIVYAFEKAVKKRNGDRERILTTRKMALIGVFSAIATVLHLLEFPVPFAPAFYELDFGELPALIGAFAFGPVAGVMIEFCKIALKLVIKGTSTAFVGDLANFSIGCSFILPASMIYASRKSKKSAVIACITGTVVITVFGTLFNVIYLIPQFAKLYGMPLQEIIDMGKAVNPSIDSTMTLGLFAVAPVNFLKGAMISIPTLLVYKKLSPILKQGYQGPDKLYRGKKD